MIAPPSLEPLFPKEHRMPNDRPLYYFDNSALELVKLDITLEAGSAYQQKKSLAHAANQLFGEASAGHASHEVADFMDFRGIVVERMTDVCMGNISYYFLRRYAAELFPLLRELFDAPAFTEQMFEAYRGKRRQMLSQGFQKTSYVARNKHYELLYGTQHPLGTYAQPEDLDRLTMADVADFQRQHYRLADAHIVVSGHVDDELLALADRYLSVPTNSEAAPSRIVLPSPMPAVAQGPHHIVVPNAVQSTIRIGRILPFGWDDPRYSRFMVLSTVLGGYFGSRLMTNIREDKGYTYGIYSQTQVFRGSIVFFIVADVAAEATQAAVDEVFNEIRQLQGEPVGGEEMERVRNFMMGDFIRSIDGSFEQSERYRQMTSTNVTEQFSANLIDAIQTTTPAEVQSLAQQLLSDLFVVTAGPSLD